MKMIKGMFVIINLASMKAYAISEDNQPKEFVPRAQPCDMAMRYLYRNECNTSEQTRTKVTDQSLCAYKTPLPNSSW